MFGLISENSTKKKVVNLLLDGGKSLIELSEKVDMSKPALLKHLDSLEDKGVVQSFKEKSRSGRRKIYKLKDFSTCFSVSEEGYAVYFEADSAFNPKFPLVNQIPQKKLRNAVLEYLKAVEGVKSPLSVIIFGSVARGEATWKSDIDAMFFSDSWKDKEDIILEKLSDISMNEDIETSMSPHFHLYGDLEKGGRLIKEVKKEGIVAHTTGEDEKLWKFLERYGTI